MNRLRQVGAFCYDFLIGDDWRLALGVLAALAITGLLAHAGHLSAWWAMPPIVIATLAVSLHAVTRRPPG